MSRMQRISVRALSIVLALLASADARAQQHPVLAQVSSLSASGSTSALIGSGAEWTPLVAGGERSIFARAYGDDPMIGDAPQLVAAARAWGKGRILVASRAFTEGAASNLRFHINAHAWLRNGRPGFIRWTTAHAEQSELGYFLINFASSVGQAWLPIIGPVGTPELDATAVLYVDDPNLEFSEAERLAILNWVAGGGGLWVNASGARWQATHAGAAPESAHPAARLLAGTGLHPVRGSIRRGDGPETNFDVLGANALSGDLGSAGGELVAIHQQHGTSLPAALEANAALRARFVALHAALAAPCTLGMTGDDVLTAASVCVSVYNASIGFYNHSQPYSGVPYPTAAYARERLWRTYIDSGFDDPAIRSELAGIAGWLNNRRKLFVDHRVLLMDNQNSTASQANAIYAWLSRIPADRVPLRAITVRDYLGTESTRLSLDGKGYKVNLFRDAPGSTNEAAFPAPFDFWRTDLFCQAAAHEIAHVVDSAYLCADPARFARRTALLDEAGSDPLNYLRSGFEPGWFQANPIEFIASIANQWVSESNLCLQLGRIRLEQGRRQPIEQALFFADMLSTGDTVPMFRCRTQGTIASRSAAVTRDAQGRITAIVDGSVTFSFAYDAAGHVSSVHQANQDCDGDGVADVDEILLTGTAADTNADMRIDGCGSVSDIDLSGEIDAADLAWLLGRWGLPARAAPESDLDGDGTVGAGDLAILLNSWGPAN